MEQAIEEPSTSWTVMPMAQAMAVIDDTGVQEVRAVFERIRGIAPCLSTPDKSGCARTAQLLATHAAIQPKEKHI